MTSQAQPTPGPPETGEPYRGISFLLSVLLPNAIVVAVEDWDPEVFTLALFPIIALAGGVLGILFGGVLIAVCLSILLTSKRRSGAITAGILWFLFGLLTYVGARTS